jgi:hypothetical protein
LQFEGGGSRQGEPVSIAQSGSYSCLERTTTQKCAIRAIKIDKITILVPLMHLTVKPRYLPVRIADEHLVFPAAVHGDTSNVGDLLIQQVTLTLVDAVESDQIGDHDFATASPEKNGKPYENKKATSTKTGTEQETVSEPGPDQRL